MNSIGMPGEVSATTAPSVERWRAARLPALPGVIISGMRCLPLATSSWLSVEMMRSEACALYSRAIAVATVAVGRRLDGAVDVVNEAVPLRVEAAASVVGLARDVRVRLPVLGDLDGAW